MSWLGETRAPAPSSELRQPFPARRKALVGIPLAELVGRSPTPACAHAYAGTKARFSWDEKRQPALLWKKVARWLRRAQRMPVS